MQYKWDASSSLLYDVLVTTRAQVQMPDCMNQWRMQDFLKEGSVIVPHAKRAQIFEATPTFG